MCVCYVLGVLLCRFSSAWLMIHMSCCVVLWFRYACLLYLFYVSYHFTIGVYISFVSMPYYVYGVCFARCVAMPFLLYLDGCMLCDWFICLM